MPQLKLQTQTVKAVDSYDLSDFIAESYGLKEYEYVAIEEVNNDSYKKFSVEKEELDDWDKDQLDTLRRTGFNSYVTRIVLIDLCNKGWIEPGEYLVYTSR